MISNISPVMWNNSLVESYQLDDYLDNVEDNECGIVDIEPALEIPGSVEVVLF